MVTIKVTVENSFVNDSFGVNIDPVKLDISEKVFNILKEENRSLGKIVPVYIKLNDEYKVFGVFTVNKGGSVSCFLDIGVPLFFDHLTLASEILGHHHLTQNNNGARKKLFRVTPEALDNGTYHLMTIKIGDVTKLRTLPKKIIYPEVPFEDFEKIKEAFITSGKVEGSIILDIPTIKSGLFIQLFLIPKEEDFRKMMPYRKNKDFLGRFDINKDEQVSNNIILIGFDIKYNIGVTLVPGISEEKDPVIIIGTNTRKFYNNTGIQMKKGE